MIMYIASNFLIFSLIILSTKNKHGMMLRSAAGASPALWRICIIVTSAFLASTVFFWTRPLPVPTPPLQSPDGLHHAHVTGLREHLQEH